MVGESKGDAHQLPRAGGRRASQSPGAHGAHLPHHSPQSLSGCPRAEHRHFQVPFEVPQWIPREMSTTLPHPGTGTHSVGGTVGCVLVLCGLVPAVGWDTVIHEPAARSRERNTLRGWGRSKTLLEGSAQGHPQPAAPPWLSFAPAALQK